jgi:PAS domain S-box-containing protein
MNFESANPPPGKGHDQQANGHGKAGPSKVQLKLGELERARTAELQNGELVCREASLREAEQAQKAVDTSEARLQQFMALLPVGMYACDAQGHITFYNRRAVELWGGEPAPDQRGDSLCTCYKACQEGMFVPLDQTPMTVTLEQGKAFHDLEMLVQRRDGSQFPASVNIDPIRDLAGQICGTITVFQDITDRKRAEEALAVTQRNLAEQVTGLSRLHLLSTRLSMTKETPAMMEAILENVVELHGTKLGLMSVYDHDRHKLSATAGVGFGPIGLHELGCVQAGEGACGTAFSERRRVIVEDIEIDPLFASYREAARRHGVRAVHSTPLLTRTGKPLGVLSVYFTTPRRPTNQEMQWADMHARQAADFLERTKGEQALQRLASIVESSEDAIVSKDINGVITSWNKSAERIFGYRSDEVVGKPVTILVPTDRLNEEPRILERIRKGERFDHFETIRRRKDGTLLHISLTISPMRDEEGHIIGASKIARDITEKKRAEQSLREAQAELARSHEELEKRVEDRTASLREAIAQMEEFSYSVSHDLRAPVRAMQGYANATIEDYGDRLDARGRDYLDRIVRGGARMDRLIQDILIYSRLARSNLKLQPVCLDRLVREIVQQYPDMQPPIAEVVIRETLIGVVAHEPSLTQAISNLLNNAVKFVNRGELPKVQIWSERRDGRVRLWVEDNGIGIKPEHQQRLFGMFERVHDGKKYEGTGIGLAIARKAVERMGGRIGVESDGITGSRFWIELAEAEKDSQTHVKP